jgi:dGTPase
LPLEGQVVDLCDSIAYDHHDLEDGLAAELIRPADLEGLALWRSAGEDVRRRYGDLPDDERVRRQVKAVIELLVSDVLENTLRRLEEMNLRTVDDVRAAPQPAVRLSPATGAAAAELEQFLHARVYRHYRVIRMQEKAKRFLRAIFEVYVNGPHQLPPAVQARIETDGVHRAVCDYLASMTDRSCLDEHRRLFEPGERV